MSLKLGILGGFLLSLVAFEVIAALSPFGTERGMFWGVLSIPGISGILVIVVVAGLVLGVISKSRSTRSGFVVGLIVGMYVAAGFAAGGIIA